MFWELQDDDIGALNERARNREEVTECIGDSKGTSALVRFMV